MQGQLVPIKILERGEIIMDEILQEVTKIDGTPKNNECTIPLLFLIPNY